MADMADTADTATQQTDRQTQESSSRIRAPKGIHSIPGEALARHGLLTLERHKSARALAVAIARSAQNYFTCKRISIVQIDSSRAQLLAISDQAKIDPRLQIPACLIRSSFETIHSKDALILHSGSTPAGTASLSPAHAELFQLNGQCPVFSFIYPLKSDSAGVARSATQQIRLAVIVENPSQCNYSREQLKSLHSAMSPVLNLLMLQLSAERSWWAQQRLKINSFFSLNTRQSLSRRWIACILVGLSIFFGTVFQVPLQVKAQALIQAKDAQVLIAPYTGIVSSSQVQAGDFVSKNQILASMDTRELLLREKKWLSESLKNKQAVDVALAARDRISLGKLRADASGIDAEMKLVKHQLDRAQLRAPFDGVILSGDLSQLVGSTVQQGDVLFTLASDGQYQLLLNIDEHDVGLLEMDQLARIRMAALPDEILTATLAEVLPIAVTEQEANYFRVPAVLDKNNERLRSGMEGIARITVGRDSMLAVYTRDLNRIIKRFLWRIGVLG